MKEALVSVVTHMKLVVLIVALSQTLAIAIAIA